MSLKVLVEDENDNSPQFTEAVYKVAISENATIGSLVIQVLANDPDYGSNADLAFTLKGRDGVFDINKTSGESWVASRLSVRFFENPANSNSQSGFYRTVEDTSIDVEKRHIFE